MPDDEKIPADWPPEPKLEMISESFLHSATRRDSNDTPRHRVEPGEKKGQ